MKLSNLNAKLTVMKNTTVKVLAAATLAGALFTVAAPAAQAQRIFVGIGGPRFYAPAPPVVVYRPYGFYGHPYYGWHDRDDFYRRHDWDRRHEWFPR
jgi:hypothetical protein